MNIIVNLLSDQTIPNLQFLKKFYKDGDHILMISTSKMEGKGVGRWILSALDHKTHQDSQIITKVVKEFDSHDIAAKLNELDLNDYDDILVNITGGTKIMSLSAYDFFKEKGAHIFYITGNNDEVLKLFPARNNTNIKLSDPVTLLEYLKAYGFNKTDSSLSGRSEEYTKFLFNWFLNDMSRDTDYPYIEALRDRRGKTYDISQKPGLEAFLEKIKFSVKNGVRLSKKDTKYLTGDWFEEYIYHRVKNEIPEADVATGFHLSKDGGQRNEFDVMFTLGSTLYTIECKTYIVSIENIVTGTLYKTTALAKGLGLFGKNYVFTLNYQKELNENHIDRAKEMGITLICREDLETDKTISELLNIKKNADQPI